ncbi:hypothetical protein M2311_004466 [Rhizobium leguminosarum]|nr:hypothetical protein [Rhizobium leguminosarum]
MTMMKYIIIYLESLHLLDLTLAFHVDVLDKYEIYLVENGDISKILYFNMERKELKYFPLDVGEFDRVALDAYDYLDRMYDAAEESKGEAS